jgi:hypothetical protein
MRAAADGPEVREGEQLSQFLSWRKQGEWRDA